jgi:type II secretory pathway predicted ATPase ExeA
LGLEPAYRRAQLWRDLKARIRELVDNKQLLPIWILDEAQNLPVEFFHDFPSFLNFAFDTRDLMTVWLVGHPCLANQLDRAPHAALSSRIQGELTGCYKIQLNRVGYRLVYSVEDDTLIVLVLSVNRRNGMLVYTEAAKRR